MKQKKIAVVLAGLGLAVLLVCGFFFWHHQKQYDGSTVESRERRLDQAIASSEGQSWTIETEEELNGCLVCGAYSTDQKAAVAVFRPDGKGKYQLQTAAYRSRDEIIVEHTAIEEESYDLIWLCGVKTEYAEVSYTIDGQEQDAMRYETADGNLLCIKAPAKEYILHIAYCDSEGSCYKA